MSKRITIRHVLGDHVIEVSFPPTVTTDNVDKLIQQAHALGARGPKITPEDIDTAQRIGRYEGIACGVDIERARRPSPEDVEGAYQRGRRDAGDGADYVALLRRIAIALGFPKDAVEHVRAEAIERRLEQVVAQAATADEHQLDAQQARTDERFISGRLLAMSAALDEAVRLMSLPDQPIAVIREGVAGLLANARSNAAQNKAVAAVENAALAPIVKAMGEHYDEERDEGDLSGKVSGLVEAYEVRGRLMDGAHVESGKLRAVIDKIRPLVAPRKHTSKCNDGPSGCDPSCPIGLPDREDIPTAIFKPITDVIAEFDKDDDQVPF